MSQQSPIFIKTEVFMMWLLQHTRKFPREERFDWQRGATHQLMATLRNLTLSLLHLQGFVHIASTLRRFVANPAQAIALVVQPLLVGK